MVLSLYRGLGGTVRGLQIEQMEHRATCDHFWAEPRFCGSTIENVYFL